MIDGLKAKYRAAIISILSANERVERAVLFGSRAMETFTPASDIDIALYGDHLTLTDQANLATAIDELPMAQRVDLLLHATVNNKALCKHIEEHGIEWYRRKTAERLDLPRRYRDQIEALLREHVPGVEVWAYGSRVKGKSHKGSDLDLVLRRPGLQRIPSSQLAELTEALEESNVPIIVQTHDWARLPERFHREIEREYVVLVEGEEWGSGNETLADFVNITMGQSPPGNTVFSLGDIPLLNGPTEFGAHHPTPTQFTTSPRKYAHVGDILFCVRGSTTGRMNWADQEYAIGRGIAAIHHRWTAKLQPFVRAVIEFELPELLAQATGSTFPNVSAAQLAAIPYPNFSGAEQRAIAHILGTLDDKIELNRRMNETLEEMARALFKSWFVDFDPVRAKMEGRDTGLPPDVAALFPDRLVDSELGEIPEGWEVKTLEDCFNLTMGQSPPGSTYNANGEGVPFFQGSADFGFRYPEKRRYCTAPTRVAELDDTFVSVRAPVGDINMAWERCCIGRGLAALRHKSGSSSFTYYSAWTIQGEISEYEHTGTVFGAINRKQFEALQVVEPRPELIEAFDTRVGPMDACIRSNTSEVYILTSIRDTLLPKLISGKIRIRCPEE